MVFCSNIRLINTNTTLSTEEDVCLIDSSSGSITITLPNITADGIRYKLIRIDSTTSNILTIQGFSALQTINGNTSLSLGINTSIAVESYDDVWYLALNNVTIGPSKSLFTTAYIQNNGTQYIRYAGSGTPRTVCSFFYSGSTSIPITRFTIVVAAENANPNGNARLVNFTFGSSVIATIPYNLSSSSPVHLSTTSISNLPDEPGVLQITVEHSGGGNRLALYSLTID